MLPPVPQREKAGKQLMRLRKAAAAAMLLVTAAFGQTSEEIVKWSVRGPETAKPGIRITVRLDAEIADGWHLYSISQPPDGPGTTVISFPGKQPFRQDGAMKTPEPQISFDPNFNMETETYEGRISFQIPVAIRADASLGDHKIAIDALYQTCNETTCLPPYTTHLFSPIKILKGVAGMGVFPRAETPSRGAAGSGQPGTQAATPPSIAPARRTAAALRVSPEMPEAGSRPLASFLWFAMVMGALSLLTPCVFPLVPITVSYFANQGSRGGALARASIYALGIVLTFTALGLALALVFGAGGVNQMAANPWVNLLIAAIFVGFALSLFGVYFIRLPAGLLNRLSALPSGRGGSSAVGVLLMGCTFTLTSFTCTAPFVGTLLVMASQGSGSWPLAGMLAYSTVFALPFFALALAPQLLAQLPRAGSWTNSVKVVMGLLEIAAAMKFLSNADLVWRWGIFTRRMVLAVWIGIGALIVLYLLGYLRLWHESSARERAGPVRLGTAMAFLAITILLVSGLFGKRLGELDSFLPPSSAELVVSGTAQSSSDGLRWILNDFGAAGARAGREQKPVFVDFTGYTCTNCRWMEANMFPRPEVRRELETFVRVRLYTDGAGDLYRRQQQFEQALYGTVALPLYAILRADGSSVAAFPGLTRNPDEFVSFLQRARSLAYRGAPVANQ